MYSLRNSEEEGEEMKKIISIILSLLTVFSFTTLYAFADDKSNADTHTETYTVNHDQYASFSPDKEIKIDGDTYSLVEFHITDDNKKTFEVVTENLPDKKYTASANIINPDNSTQSGKLINTVFTENKETERQQNITKTVDYKAVPVDYNTPKTFKTEYTDKETANVIEVQLNLENANKSSSYWINTDGFNGTVTGYDALFYNLDNSNVQIPKNDKTPNYKGYENAILKSLNLSSENYRITDSSWSGNAFYNSEGVLCRNCNYSIQIKVCDITAAYSGNVQLPDRITYTATSTYEDEKNSKYTVEANYEKTSENKISPKAIIISVVLGLLVLAAFIAIVLIYLSKKKKSEAKNEK